jgi:hypothetical protein
MRVSFQTESTTLFLRHPEVLALFLGRASKGAGPMPPHRGARGNGGGRSSFEAREDAGASG